MYPALNLAEALCRQGGDEMKVLLIGAKRGIETQIFPKREFAYQLLPLEPIYRRRPWRNWRLVTSAAVCGLALRRVFRSFRPRLVVGTGGYASGPVVAWGRLTGARTAIQEQNSVPGLTTRWLARWVDQLHLGYDEALRELRPGHRTAVRLHGNPIRWPVRRPDPATARRALGLNGTGRVVLISGGSQGAATVNSALVEALRAIETGGLPPLPHDVCLLWSTGTDHYAGVTEALSGLSGTAQVRALPYIDAMENALCLADLAISRAGALALAELCAWGVPAILVPYPFAAGDHQTGNARSLEEAGAALVVTDRALGEDPAVLWRLLVDLLGQPGRRQAMREAALSRGRPHAADRIAQDLLALLEAA